MNTQKLRKKIFCVPHLRNVIIVGKFCLPSNTRVKKKKKFNAQVKSRRIIKVICESEKEVEGQVNDLSNGINF